MHCLVYKVYLKHLVTKCNVSVMRILKKLLAFSALLLSIVSWAQSPIIANPPAASIDGITVIDPTRVLLRLHAPGKQYVHVLSDLSNWQVDNAFLMNKSVDGNTHWIILEDLTPGVKYRFQYLIDGNLAVADPYATLVLDPWNDQYIPSSSFPGLLPYPNGTDWPVSVFETTSDPYAWNDAGYNRPPQDRLIIYELLVRDFDGGQRFQDVINRMDYLQELGITAIQLMPVNEFDGNLSWGYNPGSFFAVDKYYGTAEVLKQLVDEAHQRGIAVILDIVPNHAFGLNSMVRMYYDNSMGYWAPTSNNPWFNQQATHPYSVGYDFDHGVQLTRDFWKRVFGFWLEEFHVDGFRIDLSKGLTQTNSGGDIGYWNQYDQSRVDILNDYKNHIQSITPGAYVILEHFADNPEETALANQGFMLWGDANTDFSEAVMGYGGDLSWSAWTARGWNWPNLISFMESHDKDRVAFKALSYGNASGGYDVKNLATAMKRIEMAFAFMICTPGPKMIWQWGEYGYDVSIEDCGNGTLNNNCKTDEKPDHWEYLNVPERLQLFKVVRALNALKKDHNTFSTFNFSTDFGGSGKRLQLYDGTMNAVVVGNFDVNGFNMVPGFNHTGTWYDYFTGASLTVNDINASLYFAPGDYHIYTDQPLATPDIDGNVPLFVAAGCTDANAVNYDPLADGDDGSCLYNLTFNVDMSQQTVSPLGVHVAGSFQGWSPGSTAMTDNGDGTWSATVQVNAGLTIEYKYINGNDWPGAETVTVDCGAPDGFGGFNRFHQTAANSASIPVHCFGECAACILPAVDVTFQVDMSQQVVDAAGVHIAGSFQLWDPSTHVMTDNGNGIWSYTVALVPGTEVEYKFVNGNAWGQEEAVPVECATGGNRSLLVPSSQLTLDVVCFAACADCQLVPFPGCIDVGAANYNAAANEDDGSCVYTLTFLLDMSETSVLPEGLHLAGNWQGWDPTSIGMPELLGGVYVYTTTFAPGYVIEYKYVNGTDWSQAEAVPLDCGVPDGFNGYQRTYITIASTDTIPLHCFSSCVACSGCSGEQGCTYPLAVNFSPTAEVDNGTCEFPGCTDPTAINFSLLANVDDGSCVFAASFCGENTVWDPVLQQCIPGSLCQGDFNFDGFVNSGDLLQFLSNLGTACP